MNEPTTPGSALLQWMKDHGVSHATLGKAVGKSAGAVYGWTADEFRPEALVRQKLERYTRGEVPASIWLTVAEQAELASVHPHSATGTDG